MYIRRAPHLRLRSIFRLKSAPHLRLLYIMRLVSLKAIWLAPWVASRLRHAFLNQAFKFWNSIRIFATL
ncbi:hypothetical protein HanXRQr2_Chr16g0768901 [Helianthus annuus]|uniref:Uncharacterized protein n=1 Tax=Helianthus annuus TaxID=4232 RepID=A0A9K3DW10_HELAN|nr:hypothetical protein HanXRQr2_Chr16g0768901 [Helianthus annuus]